MSLPIEVIHAVQQQRCVLVLGSRASLEAARLAGRDYPKAAALARKLGWQRPRRIMGSKTRPQLPSVELGAAKFEDANGRTRLIRELRGLVGVEGVPPSQAHRIAVQRFPMIFSTAWDDLLQRAAVGAERELQLVYRGQEIPEPHGDQRVLLRLRGGFEQARGMVITARDHQENRFGSQVRRSMRQLVRGNTLLFVGFRPDEEEFDRLWEDLTDAYGGELPRCHMAVAQGPMDDFLWQKWVWRGLLLFTADPVECLAEIEERLPA